MRLAACTTLIVLATAGVASAQPSKSPAASAACSFFTKEDAAAALGEAVSKGPIATAVPAGPSACDYEGSGIHHVQLTVRPLSAAEAAMYTSLCAQKKKDGLTGLGNVTCWYNDKHEELQVLKGLTFFSIEIRRSGDPTEAIKAAAQKVYARVK
jgi:hypothetical protein